MSRKLWYGFKLTRAGVLYLLSGECLDEAYFSQNSLEVSGPLSLGGAREVRTDAELCWAIMKSRLKADEKK